MDDNKEDNLMEGTNELIENDDAEGLKNEVHVDAEEETAETLMTDMKLDDETDYLRDIAPGKSWIYHIEAFPWSADDMTESIIKIIKLASFTHIALKRKKVSKETNEQESLDDKIQQRQRSGCFHIYVDSWKTAKTIMRSLTWKTMSQKELTVEITRRFPEDGHTETAYLVADTYLLSKIRFRDKLKGEFKDRSAKVSNIPGTLTKEFLEMVFSRAYVSYDGSAIDSSRNKETNLQIKLQEMENFNGSVDLDCLSKGSCRSLVLAYKSLFICGQKITVTANNEQTMVAPPFTHDMGVKTSKGNLKKEIVNIAPAYTSTPKQGRGILQTPDNTSLGAIGGVGRGRARGAAAARARGTGRGSLMSFRPASAPFPRAGPGMPVPMTGRQKMNEKLRRMNPSSVASNPFMMSGGTGGTRASGLGSMGGPFKQEIASLQNQLELNTQALEAQIARLKHETSYFKQDMIGYNESQWNNDNFDYEEDLYSPYGALHHDYGDSHHEHMHMYQSEFSQKRPKGVLGMKGMKRGAGHKIPSSSASPRMEMMQPGSRGGGRGRGFMPARNPMSHSDHQNIFW